MITNRRVVCALFCILLATLATAQSLEKDATAVANKLGYTGQLLYNSGLNGAEEYIGEGLSIVMGGAVRGALEIAGMPSAPFNRGVRPVSSSDEAVIRAKLFIVQLGPKLGTTQLAPDTLTKVWETKLAKGSGWTVELRHNAHGHRGMPVYYASIRTDGTLARLTYLPLPNAVAAAPIITEEEAKNILIKESAITGAEYSIDHSELLVGPDHKGGADLMWVMFLNPTSKVNPELHGQVDAVTGEILNITSPVSAPPVIPDGHVSAKQEAAPIIAYALLVLAALLVIFLVVKLRKR